jgi:hypothetical protein
VRLCEAAPENRTALASWQCIPDNGSDYRLARRTKLLISARLKDKDGFSQEFGYDPSHRLDLYWGAAKDKLRREQH